MCQAPYHFKWVDTISIPREGCRVQGVRIGHRKAPTCIFGPPGRQRTALPVQPASSQETKRRLSPLKCPTIAGNHGHAYPPSRFHIETNALQGTGGWLARLHRSGGRIQLGRWGHRYWRIVAMPSDSLSPTVAARYYSVSNI
jgi:hypothetical protein